MKNWYKNPWIIAAAILIVGLVAWGYRSRAATPTVAAVTAPAEQGTLVQSVTGSGSLIAKIQADVTAPTYGRVDQVLVKSGDVVKADQALLKLHALASDADKAKGLAALLSSQDSANQAQTKLLSLQATATTAQQQLQDAQKNEKIASTTLTSAQLSLSKSGVDATQAAIDAQKSTVDAGVAQSKAGTDQESTAADLGSESATVGEKSSALGAKKSVADATAAYQQAQRDQASAHLKTKSAQLSATAAQQTLANQQTSIAAARASYSSSRLAYQMLTDQMVTAPVAGTIVNMGLVTGSTVGTNTDSSSTTTSSTSSGTKLFSIIDFNSLRVNVSVSEVDISRVKLGQAATLTFDALTDKTYTGTVTNIDTVGTSTSGVISYSVEITLDQLAPELKPGMTVSASIITNRKDNVVVVPSSAVQTTNNQSTVQVIKNGITETVAVQIGDSNDSQTEITSGITAGDTIVVSPATQTSSSTSSPFSGRNAGFGGAARGAVRLGG